MHSVIVGAGPTGLYTAVALARRGHQVTVIDRDPGPDGSRNRGAAVTRREQVSCRLWLLSALQRPVVKIRADPDIAVGPGRQTLQDGLSAHPPPGGLAERGDHDAESQRPIGRSARSAASVGMPCLRFINQDMLITMTGSSTPSANPAALRLRALAHPLRWKLFDIVFREGTATATRCAELTGESVASCYYHLNILGKYGYVEQVPGSGKEKPWRSVSTRQDLSAPGPELADRLASEAATEAFLEHEFDRLRTWRRLQETEPAEWRDATGVGGSTMWVTAEELRQIHDEITLILRRYIQRSEDPVLRPSSARAARVFFYTAVSPRS